MSRYVFILALAAAGVAVSPQAQAGPNIPLCFAIQKNFGDCVRGHDRNEWRYRDEYEEWEEAGGWRVGPPPQPPLDCNAWLVELQANHCI